MIIHEIRRIDESNHKGVTFIRVEPKNLQTTLEGIISELSDLAWISKFDKEYIRDSFTARAMPTILDITKKLKESSLDKITGDAGEYVVSMLSRNALDNQLNYLCAPLAELFNKQISGNPGFDFHAQNNSEILIFGEAKYVNKRSAYGRGLSQVVEFIDQKKDIKDLADLGDFFHSDVLDKVAQGTKGFAIGFSAITTPTAALIENIIQNEHYKLLLAYEEIILIAVNL
jgi:hypothetical protein